jgi:hypothetical protein
VLTRLGLIAEPDLFRMLAEHLQVDWIQKDDFPEAPLDIAPLPTAFLFNNHIAPVKVGRAGHGVRLQPNHKPRLCKKH